MVMTFDGSQLQLLATSSFAVKHALCNISASLRVQLLSKSLMTWFEWLKTVVKSALNYLTQNESKGHNINCVYYGKVSYGSVVRIPGLDSV